MQRLTPSNLARLARWAPALLALSIGWPAVPAAADGGPPVRMIVPLAAGSTADVVARALGQQFGHALGRPVVVENIPGAAGLPGTARIVRAPKDGSALGMVASNHVINPAMFKSMPYDAVKDVTPIMVVGSFPLVLVAIPSLPVNDAGELVALAKAQPGRLNFGSGGHGSILHLAVELLRAEVGGLDVRHVPYNGSGQMAADLMRGQIQFGFLAVTVATPLLEAGKLRALGLSTRTRSPALPDVPTLAEQGLSGYAFDAWVALVGPAGMARATVARYHDMAHKALATPDLQAVLARQGMRVIGNTPAQAAAFLRAELAKHARLVRQAGAGAD